MILKISEIMDILSNNTGSIVMSIVVISILIRILMLPVTIWVHKNSIKLIKIQPEINRIKIKYFKDNERIAEEQAKIYKRAKYNPLADLIPLFLQIALLILVIEVIKLNLETTNLNKEFLGLDLSVEPYKLLNLYYLVPIIAGFSSLVLSLVQNKLNIIQEQSSKFSQYFTMFISVGLSLYLGIYVPYGVAIYWIVGNLLNVIQSLLLYIFISPKKYINYEELEETKKQLNNLNQIGKDGKKWYQKDKYSKREKQDYKKFFSIANKKVVFYSEKSGFYKYFQGLIDNLLDKTNISVHYITSDPNDQIFELAKTNERIKPYYIGESKLITLMMKMDAEIVLMTMPDIEKYHIKRSLVKKDIEYIFVPHWITSTTMVIRENALDNYDTVLCVGQHWVEEIRKSEEIYKTKSKNLVEFGYSHLDNLIRQYKNISVNDSEIPQILIAPSYQPDNIMDSCIDEILDRLVDDKNKVILRPHPQYCKLYPFKIELLKKKYINKFNDKFILELDFSSNHSIFESDVVITDWSNIGYEFSLSTKKPSIFINTPMKTINENYKKITPEPVDILLRDKVGKSLDIKLVKTIDSVVKELVMNKNKYEKQINNTLNEYIFNIENSDEVGAKYIIKSLIEKKGK